ncbi:MAG: hypothetical protein ACFFCO_09650 [Promethearchaeota archaeon]
MAEKYLLLLDFAGGIVKPIPLSPTAITDDHIVIVIDELNACVWIWKGANTSMIESRAAQRQARSIMGLGYEIQGMHLTIGFRAVSRLEIVDGQALDDPDMKRNYDLLMFTLSQSFDMLNETLGKFTGTFIAPASPPPASLPCEAAPAVSTIPETAAPVDAAPSPVSTPEPSRSSSSTSTTSTGPREVSSSAPSGDMSVVRVGILISSILEYFSSVFCAIKRGEDSALYSIEDADGILCEVEVKGGSIRFLQRYDFRGKREAVLTLLQTRLASVGL